MSKLQAATAKRLLQACHSTYDNLKSATVDVSQRHKFICVRGHPTTLKAPLQAGRQGTHRPTACQHGGIWETKINMHRSLTTLKVKLAQTKQCLGLFNWVTGCRFVVAHGRGQSIRACGLTERSRLRQWNFIFFFLLPNFQDTSHTGWQIIEVVKPHVDDDEDDNTNIHAKVSSSIFVQNLAILSCFFFMIFRVGFWRSNGCRSNGMFCFYL